MKHESKRMVLLDYDANKLGSKWLVGNAVRFLKGRSRLLPLKEGAITFENPRSLCTSAKDRVWTEEKFAQTLRAISQLAPENNQLAVLNIDARFSRDTFHTQLAVFASSLPLAEKTYQSICARMGGKELLYWGKKQVGELYETSALKMSGLIAISVRLFYPTPTSRHTSHQDSIRIRKTSLGIADAILRAFGMPIPAAQPKPAKTANILQINSISNS